MTARTYVDPFDPRAQVLTVWEHDPNATPKIMDDPGPEPRLSRSARREQRRPVPLRVDSMGYDRRGRYYPQYDGEAS